MRQINIDLLRVLSILIVVINHYGLYGHKYFNGTHGVILFFFISGYCIQLTTYKKQTFNEFWIARYKRLIPIFFLCTITVSVIRYFFWQLTPERYFNWIFAPQTIICLPTLEIPCLIHKYFVKSLNYAFVDGAYWSLLVEFKYYFLFSILWYIFRIRSSIIYVLVALSFLSIYTARFSNHSINDFFIYLVFFSFGMAYHEFKLKSKKNGLFAGIFALAAFFIHAKIGVVTPSFSLDHGNYLSYFSLFFLFIFVMEVFAFKNSLKSSFISYAGLLTYAIYLLHQEIGLLAIFVIKKHTGLYIAAFLAFCIIILLALIIQKICDKLIK